MPSTDVITNFLGPDDASVLDNVADGVFDNPVSRERTVAFLKERTNLLAVALAGDTVIGMASGFVYLHPDKLPQLFVNEVGLAEAFRRQGIGKRLLRLLLENGRRLSCEVAWVATDEDNAAGRALFASYNGKEEPKHAVVFTYDLSKDFE